MKKYYIILLFVFLSLCLYLGYLLSRVSENPDNESNFYQGQAADILLQENNVQQLYFNFQFEKMNSGRKIDNKLRIEFDYNEFIGIDEIVDGNSKLVFFYSESHCSTCIEVQLALLSEFEKIIKPSNLIILSSYNNIRNLFNDKELYNLDCITYNVHDQASLISEGNVGQPFYFILDETLILKDIFVPSKEIPQFTSAYFSIIKEKYFNS